MLNNIQCIVCKLTVASETKSCALREPREGGQRFFEGKKVLLTLAMPRIDSSSLSPSSLSFSLTGGHWCPPRKREWGRKEGRKLINGPSISVACFWLPPPSAFFSLFLLFESPSRDFLLTSVFSHSPAVRRTVGPKDIWRTDSYSLPPFDYTAFLWTVGVCTYIWVVVVA